MDLNQFLGHSTQSSSSGSKYLDRWKKNTPPQVDIWLHTQALIESLWRHNVPRIVERERDGEKSVEVWSGNWNCWESEDVLINQYKRDYEAGTRAYPPCICPVCKLIEYVRDSVEQGDLVWTAPIFRFAGSDASKSLVIRAAGLYNGFSKKDLSDNEKNELKEARIYRTEAWKQNMMAKMSYVFTVVNNAEPGKGPQIAIETPLLGDKVKEVINKAMMSAEDEGNPLENPYAIRWMYKPDESQFDRKYDAVKMDRIPYTKEIQSAICDTKAPDLGGVIARQDPSILLAQLQDAHRPFRKTFEIPLEDIFAEAIAEWNNEAADFDPDKYEDEEKAKPRVSMPKPSARQSSKRRDDDEDGGVARSRQSEPQEEPRQNRTTRRAIQPAKGPSTGKKALCVECGEFIPVGESICVNCGHDNESRTAPWQDSEDDLPF